MTFAVDAQKTAISLLNEERFAICEAQRRILLVLLLLLDRNATLTGLRNAGVSIGKSLYAQMRSVLHINSPHSHASDALLNPKPVPRVVRPHLIRNAVRWLIAHGVRPMPEGGRTYTLSDGTQVSGARV